MVINSVERDEKKMCQKKKNEEKRERMSDRDWEIIQGKERRKEKRRKREILKKEKMKFEKMKKDGKTKEKNNKNVKSQSIKERGRRETENERWGWRDKENGDILSWFGFFVFNGISTFEGYLMPKIFS